MRGVQLCSRLVRTLSANIIPFRECNNPLFTPIGLFPIGFMIVGSGLLNPLYQSSRGW
jgi:hypothetical protein